jgi:hypothetical protein
MRAFGSGARKVVRLGGAAAIGGLGVAAAPVFSQGAAANPGPTSYGCSSIVDLGGDSVYDCYVELAQSGSNYTGPDVELAGGPTSLVLGNCNLALYAGQSVEVGDAIYQTPVAPCYSEGSGVYHEAVDTGIAPKSGEWYTAAIWVSGGVQAQVSAVWPFSSDCKLGC